MSKEEIGNFIREAASSGESCHFPRWEDFPEVDLYMDQVIELVNGYLSEFMPFSGETVQLTPAMVNNYVKSKTVPPPVKKRYSRRHLAYIIMVCILKQSFNIATIQKIIRCSDAEERIRDMYNTFAEIQENTLRKSTADIEAVVGSGSGGSMSEFILRLVSLVNIYKNLAERLVYEDSRPKLIKRAEN